jgi:tRNA1(Val) A37 N6-methylase TrmN6
VLFRSELISGTPPYFPRGTGTESTKAHALACRFEVRGGVEAYLAVGAKLLSERGRIVVCTAALETDRVKDGAQAAKLHVVEHLEVIGREGKAPLVMIDVLQREAAPVVSASMTVRQANNQWTPAFRRVREAFGIPTEPP